MEKILPYWIIIAPALYVVADYMMSSKTTSMGAHANAGTSQGATVRR